MDDFWVKSGTQVLASDVIKVLNDIGYTVDVLTSKSSKFIPEGVHNVFYIDYPKKSLTNRINILYNMLNLKKQLLKFDFNSYDITFNNRPNIYLMNASFNYLHGPVFFESFLDQNGNVKNIFLYEIIKTLGLYKIYNTAIFLTHGEYSARYSAKGFDKLNIKPNKIIPINIPVNYPWIEEIPEKEEYMLTFGRITPDKMIDRGIRIAELSRIPYKVAGFVPDRWRSYFEDLRSRAPSNVEFIESPSEDEKIELFKRAQIYLHTKDNEHYGVTTAEAIWFGCIPITPKNGGSWEDILEYGRYGLGYKSVDEAIKMIEVAKRMDDQRRSEIFESRERFKFEHFEERISKLIDEI
ncbi:glycosyltransferase [Thermoplasma sp. Kam2015]|uniref:glycosyltransferase n=1 Tax=Thermoplasma sp. Kam2015 TaxID=2094122 RepID=UPI001293ECE9|nr:glycosyltransferase [Thermoplasma sp. Kam2015]